MVHDCPSEVGHEWVVGVGGLDGGGVRGVSGGGEGVSGV